MMLLRRLSRLTGRKKVLHCSSVKTDYQKRERAALKTIAEQTDYRKKYALWSSFVKTD
jgi:hypothetical protein